MRMPEQIHAWPWTECGQNSAIMGGWTDNAQCGGDLYIRKPQHSEEEWRRALWDALNPAGLSPQRRDELQNMAGAA